MLRYSSGPRGQRPPPSAYLCSSLRVNGLSTAQPRGVVAKEYQTGQKDGVFTSQEEAEAQEAQTKIVPASCQIWPPEDQETAL